jgi:hypothetical protein
MSVSFHRFLSKSASRRALHAAISPILTDVSLRDGIQCANPEYYTTFQKKDIFHTILFQENPPYMEVGSLVNPKILPIMSDSLDIYKYASNQEWLIDRNMMMDLFNSDEPSTIPLNSDYNEKRYFLLMSSLKQIPIALENGVKNMSFITSTTDEFQRKNTNKNLEETKSEFSRIFLEYPKLSDLYTKLYISCIRECPIIGPVDLDWIVKEILYYHTKYPFQEICLSDTCGSLTYEDFEYIVETIKIFGLPYSKISLHLHVNAKKTEHIEHILYFCFKNGINKFDVSLLHMGGCSVTIPKSDNHPNLTYKDFYEILQKYIEFKES